MSTPLLATKLYVPPTPVGLVPRPRLVEQLDQAQRAARRLTLISAPAGSGKTTLLAQWIADSDRRANGKSKTADPPLSAISHLQVAWLSLDESDNDPARFFSYLIAALQTLQADVGHATRAMLQAPQPPPIEAALGALVNDLATISFPIALVLDDYHAIQAPPIHHALTFLLDHFPPSLRLILATRADPPLPLARLRARGQLTEIRADDLRFALEEVAAFLKQALDLDLPREQVAALGARTEGWIAGLQLAALSLRGRADAREFVESFTGSDRFVLDYLIEEVYQRQSPEVQEFLLKTSILERLSAPLCDALWRADVGDGKLEGRNISPISNFQFPISSQQVLDYLESANLFLVPLDASRQWYRYHRLFADLLRHRLTLDSRYAVAQLHQRASAWYAANDFAADAIHHALAARDWARAATLILGETGTMLTRGEIVTLLKWLKALPDDSVRGNPELCLSYSWALILTGQLDAAETYLAQAETVARASNIASLVGSIYAAHAHIARARGDDRRTIELSQRALASLPAEAFDERSVLALNLGIASLNQGHIAEAEQAFGEAARTAQQSANHHVRLIALTFLGIVQIIRGKLHQGEEFFQQAIHSGSESPAVALAHLHYGALLYEWNDLNAAAEHLQRGLELGQRGGNPEVQMGVYRTLALLKQAQGDASAARSVMEQAQQFARDHNLPPIMHAAIAATCVQIALAQNDLPAAVRWAEQATQIADASPLYPALGLARARLLIAQKQNCAAAAELAKCSESVARVGWEGGLIAIRVLQSLAAETHTARLEFLTDALERAQSEGYFRTFADAGRALLPLLQDVALRGTSPEYVGKLLRAIAEGQGGRGAKGRAISSAPLRPDSPALTEPLSEREIEVLRLLAAGLSNRAIAKKLVISLGTAKTHVHNIFGKLDAQNRVQAVERARELRII